MLLCIGIWKRDGLILFNQPDRHPCLCWSSPLNLKMELVFACKLKFGESGVMLHFGELEKLLTLSSQKPHTCLQSQNPLLKSQLLWVPAAQASPGTGQLTPVLTLTNVVKHSTDVQVFFFSFVRMISSGNSLESSFSAVFWKADNKMCLQKGRRSGDR